MMRNFVFIVLFLISGMVGPVFADSEMEIFQDPNFSSPTTNFSPGQAVYIKIDSDDPAELERILKLKDSQYNDISTFQLLREGFGPFIYKVSFTAPSTAGFYSVEATIASTGSQNKLVKTIQIGTPNNIETNIDVRSEVKGTKNQQSTPSKTPQPKAGQPQAETPTATPAVESELPPVATTSPTTVESASFWQKIVQFFQSVFKFFFRF